MHNKGNALKKNVELLSACRLLTNVQSTNVNTYLISTDLLLINNLTSLNISLYLHNISICTQTFSNSDSVKIHKYLDAYILQFSVQGIHTTTWIKNPLDFVIFKYVKLPMLQWPKGC
jgi:type IV secretory pathway component VirB8